jgi:hypothetical protein
MLLRRSIIGCHALLMSALVASLLPPATALRVGAAALLCLPLLLLLRGLVKAERAALQRLAVLLVAYVGGLSVEVVARAGAAPALSVALLAAVLELGALLALIRRSAPAQRAARE